MTEKSTEELLREFFTECWKIRDKSYFRYIAIKIKDISRQWKIFKERFFEI